MLVYIGYFISGFCIVNAIPHFVNGVMGNSFPSPFGRPPGVGESSPLVNVLWGAFNLVAGVALLKWTGFFEIGLNLETGAWFAGFMVVSVVLAVVFGKRHK